MKAPFEFLIDKIGSHSTYTLMYYARVLGHMQYGKLCEAQLLNRLQRGEYLKKLMRGDYDKDFTNRRKSARLQHSNTE